MEVENLIKKIIDGDQGALRILYEMFVDGMYSTALRITNDNALSQDIVSEAFLTSFNKLPSLTNWSNYEGWLRRIVINKALRMHKNRVQYAEVTDLPFEIEEDNTWFSDLTFAQIKRAIQQLPQGARSIFSLYAIEGYSHAEIAASYEISISTSKSQYRYARLALRDILTKMYANEL